MAFQSVSQPTIASLVNGLGLNKVTESSPEKHWAPMSLPKPTLGPAENDGSSQPAAVTPTIGPTQEPQIITPTSDSAQTAAPLSAPTEAPTLTPSETPTESPTVAATVTSQASGGSQDSNESQASAGSETSDPAQAAAAPQATETPVVMAMEMVADVPAYQPAKQPVPPASNAPLPAAAADGSGARWIDVDLSNQTVYAYAGDTLVNSFLVSTGTRLTPTVTGQYKIYVKYRSAAMSGPGYYLPNVPYIMYFYKGYGLHGTYWHNNFGTPMSHGCVNLRTDEAAWLYNWASVGTLVNVHY
jgi:lipoprotein-anchoring transpeptidase ErfK/SrfK